MKRYGVGVTKACAAVMISRSLYRYESCRRDSGALVMRIHEIALYARSLRIPACTRDAAPRRLSR